MTEVELKQESKAWETRKLKDRVFEFLRSKPEANIIEIYIKFPNAHKRTLRQYKWEFGINKEGINYYNITQKYNELLKVFRSFYYTIHLGKFVPVEPLNKADLELVKQLEAILKEG